jgi:hypothetical protein
MNVLILLQQVLLPLSLGDVLDGELAAHRRERAPGICALQLLCDVRQQLGRIELKGARHHQWLGRERF